MFRRRKGICYEKTRKKRISQRMKKEEEK